MGPCCTWNIIILVSVASLSWNTMEATTVSSYTSHSVDLTTPVIIETQMSSVTSESNTQTPTMTSETTQTPLDSTTGLGTTTTTRSTTPTTPGPLPEGLRLDLLYKLKMAFTVNLTLNYTDDLQNRYSSAYQTLAAHVRGIVETSFANCRAFLQADVINFARGSVIASYITYYDPHSLVYKHTVNTSDIQLDIENIVMNALKTYDEVDPDYIDTIMKEELNSQIGSMSSVVNDPCGIPGICRNPCYNCSSSELRCQLKPCGTRDFYGCVVNGVMQAECACNSNYDDIDGECVHEHRGVVIVTGGTGAIVLLTVLVIAAFVFRTCLKIGERNREKWNEMMTAEDQKRAGVIAQTSSTNLLNDSTVSFTVGHVNKSYEATLDDGVRLRVSSLKSIDFAGEYVPVADVKFDISDKSSASNVNMAIEARKSSDFDDDSDHETKL